MWAGRRAGAQHQRNQEGESASVREASTRRHRAQTTKAIDTANVVVGHAYILLFWRCSSLSWGSWCRFSTRVRQLPERSILVRQLRTSRFSMRDMPVVCAEATALSGPVCALCRNVHNAPRLTVARQVQRLDSRVARINLCHQILRDKLQHLLRDGGRPAPALDRRVTERSHLRPSSSSSLTGHENLTIKYVGSCWQPCVSRTSALFIDTARRPQAQRQGPTRVYQAVSINSANGKLQLQRANHSTSRRYGELGVLCPGVGIKAEARDGVVTRTAPTGAARTRKMSGLVYLQDARAITQLW